MLHEHAETRAAYPFAFRLEIAYELDDDAIEERLTVTNPGRSACPRHLGRIPDLRGRWPMASTKGRISSNSPSRNGTGAAVGGRIAASPIGTDADHGPNSCTRAGAVRC